MSTLKTIGLVAAGIGVGIAGALIARRLLDSDEAVPGAPPAPPVDGRTPAYRDPVIMRKYPIMEALPALMGNDAAVTYLAEASTSYEQAVAAYRELKASRYGANETPTKIAAEVWEGLLERRSATEIIAAADRMDDLVPGAQPTRDLLDLSTMDADHVSERDIADMYAAFAKLPGADVREHDGRAEQFERSYAVAATTDAVEQSIDPGQTVRNARVMASAFRGLDEEIAGPQTLGQLRDAIAWMTLGIGTPAAVRTQAHRLVREYPDATPRQIANDAIAIAIRDAFVAENGDANGYEWWGPVPTLSGE